MKNIFQKIIAKEIPAHIIYEDQDILAFLDISPKANGHTLVVPKIQSTNLLDIKESDLKVLMAKSIKLAKMIIKQVNVDSYQLHVNNGANSGQEVFYTHIHIVPTNKNNNQIKLQKINNLD